MLLLLLLRHLIRGGFHFEFPPSPSESILPSPARLVILFGNQMPKLSTTGFYNRQLALRCLWKLLGIARTCETWQVDVMSMVNNGISFIPNWVAWCSSLAVKSAPFLSIASIYILAPQSIISHIKAEECTQKVKTPHSCWARNLERACSTVGAVDPSPWGAFPWGPRAGVGLGGRVWSTPSPPLWWKQAPWCQRKFFGSCHIAHVAIKTQVPPKSLVSANLNHIHPVWL